MTKKLIAILFILMIFSLGVFSGFYYHDELSVWLNISVNNETQTPQVTTEPLAQEVMAGESEEESSTLTLPNLDEPIPLIYSDTLDESMIQEYLKEGAVILPLGPLFGDPGNVVVTAHSSGTVAFGPYRQAFARLSELKEGEEFIVQTDKDIFKYKVYAKEVVWPHEVDKLPNDDRSTVTLVTCWPLWTNFKRLLVHSELIERTELNTQTVLSN